MGNYEEIVETGFNIKDILDSYNQAMKQNDKEDKTKKNTFTAENGPAGSPKKQLEVI